MIDEIILAVIMLVMFGAIRYIVKEKAKGNKCIGCPNSAHCARHCSCSDKADIRWQE